jgi:ComF family protein
MQKAGADLVAAAAVAVPVPLHRARVRERGFNQAADLARHLGLPTCAALERVRRTHSQTQLHASQRMENISGAFRVTRAGLMLRGQTVLLVDDVRTTGATLEACANALKGAGVRAVYALTAARVERSGR